MESVFFDGADAKKRRSAFRPDLLFRDENLYLSPGWRNRPDHQRAAAHGGKTLPDVFECHMRFAIVRHFKSWPVIRDDDSTAVLRFPCFYREVQRTAFRINSVLDRVFHDWLEG